MEDVQLFLLCLVGSLANKVESLCENAAMRHRSQVLILSTNQQSAVGVAPPLYGPV